MTEEQIKQNALKASKEHGNFNYQCQSEAFYKGYIEGAHSRDEEFALLKAEIEDDNAVIKQLKAELAKAKNPWRDAKTDSPKKNMEKERQDAIRYIGANYDEEQLNRLLSGEVQPNPFNEEPLIQVYIAGMKSRDEEVDKLKRQHEKDKLLLESADADNKFLEEFFDYLYGHAIGDKSKIIEAIEGNDHNWLIGYVKAEKSLNSMQRLILEFEPCKGEGKYRAEWQPSDNYACWQKCMFDDDYEGFLLFPTYKDDEYFCIGYSC